MSDPAGPSLPSRERRASAARERRDRVRAGWDLPRGAVLVAAGAPIPIAGTDQEHAFHAHPEYQYLTGLGAPGGVLAYDPGEGWTLFAPQLTPEELVWTSAPASLEAQAAATGLDDVRDATQLRAWLERRRGEPLALLGNPDLATRPADYRVDGWSSLELTLDEDLAAQLSTGVSERRRSKDAVELALLQAAVDAAVAGHRLAQRIARPGMTERALQIEVEAEFFRQGAQRTAYGSIVGGGFHGSVLHGTPRDRAFQPGDLLLIDAGPELDGYASDVTRTFPISATFSALQRDLYELALAAQTDAIAGAVPGAEYKDLHLAAARTIAAGLADLGILRGDPDSLVEQDAQALFFPHGLGHMLGLATHDCGGFLQGREPSDRFGLRYLRTDLPLQPGYVVTVEPGIYFIRALLTDPARRERYREAIHWKKVDAMLDFGGIRIEDDVLITEDGNRVLSAALAKTVADLEQVRGEALA